MSRYVLDLGSGSEIFFDADNADEARRIIVRRLGSDGIDRATLTGPSGQSWLLWHTRREDGLAGWRYKDAKGAEGRVYQNLAPKPGTLWAGGWQGIYDVGGLYMVAFDSMQFDDSDFALVGAVYYTMYDDDGEVDGGWFGYNELTTFEDFLDFAGFHPKDVHMIVKESDPRFDDIQEALDDGTYARSDSPKPRGSKSRNKRSSSGKKRIGKEGGRKENGRR